MGPKSNSVWLSVHSSRMGHGETVPTSPVNSALSDQMCVYSFASCLCLQETKAGTSRVVWVAQGSHRRFGEFPQFPNSPAKISFNFVVSCHVMRPRWLWSTHLHCFAKWASSWMLPTSCTSSKCDITVTPHLWLVGRHHHGTKNSTRKTK